MLQTKQNSVSDLFPLVFHWHVRKCVLTLKSGLNNQFINPVIEKKTEFFGLLEGLKFTITHSVLHFKMFDYQAKI